MREILEVAKSAINFWSAETSRNGLLLKMVGPAKWIFIWIRKSLLDNWLIDDGDCQNR
jgi:hypothetical protein